MFEELKNSPYSILQINPINGGVAHDYAPACTSASEISSRCSAPSSKMALLARNICKTFSQVLRRFFFPFRDSVCKWRKHLAWMKRAMIACKSKATFFGAFGSEEDNCKGIAHSSIFIRNTRISNSMLETCSFRFAASAFCHHPTCEDRSMLAYSIRTLLCYLSNKRKFGGYARKINCQSETRLRNSHRHSHDYTRVKQ